MYYSNTWHFGYKAHIGVDQDSGLVHSVEVTGANTHDVTMVPKLLTGEENTVYGDSGYLGAEKRDDAITRNTKGKRSSTEPIGGHHKSGRNLFAPKPRSNAANTKSHLSEQK